MNRETMSSDVRYALGQLRRLQNVDVNTIMAGAYDDMAQRAIDALERVEAGLAGADALDGSEHTRLDCGSERGLPCDTGLQDQIGERQYDYGCYGT